MHLVGFVIRILWVNYARNTAVTSPSFCFVECRKEGLYTALRTECTPVSDRCEVPEHGRSQVFKLYAFAHDND